MKTTNIRSGFTLLELVMAVSILAVILAITYPILTTGTTAYGSGVKRVDLDRNSNRVIDEIAGHMSLAGASTVYPNVSAPTWSSYVVYYENQGYLDGAVQWGPVQVIYWRHATEESNDNQDNDGDGLVDEGEIVRWTYDYDTGEPKTVVLATNVPEYLEGEIPNGVDDNGNGLIDERGLAFSRTGRVWTIRLSLQKPGGNDRSLIQTVETAITPRNQ